jgi:hypothetical protein
MMEVRYEKTCEGYGPGRSGKTGKNQTMGSHEVEANPPGPAAQAIEEA